MSATHPILRLESVSKHFGGLRVVEDLNLAVRRGVRTALIGPNGAGKTTVFNLITGVFPVDAGRILLDGVDITATSSHLRIGHGIARSFQNIRLMPHLSTLDHPARVVVDLPNTVIASAPRLIDVYSDGVKAVRLGTDGQTTPKPAWSISLS